MPHEFKCPYFICETRGGKSGSIRNGIVCEGGRLNFNYRETRLCFIEGFCDSFDWRKCPMANRVNRLYTHGETMREIEEVDDADS